MSKKGIVLVHIYDDKSTLEYRARLLGVITDAEFEALMIDKVLAKKMLTCEGKTIQALIHNTNEVVGNRLLFSIKEKENEYFFRTLLVTDTISKYNYTTPAQDQVAFGFTANNWVAIHEDDDES